MFKNKNKWYNKILSKHSIIYLFFFWLFFVKDINNLVGDDLKYLTALLLLIIFLYIALLILNYYNKMYNLIYMCAKKITTNIQKHIILRLFLTVLCFVIFYGIFRLYIQELYIINLYVMLILFTFHFYCLKTKEKYQEKYDKNYCAYFYYIIFTMLYIVCFCYMVIFAIMKNVNLFDDYIVSLLIPSFPMILKKTDLLLKLKEDNK
ncbi:hypothetical protein KHQ81_10850 [Mycoplasmatota bacterium]|nr:hypothetical protein KHQ81_10850 [Mycoplasmatota bacterium]